MSWFARALLAIAYEKHEPEGGPASKKADPAWSSVEEMADRAESFNQRHVWVSTIAPVLLFVIGCSAATSVTPAPKPKSQSFSINAVQASFMDDCKERIVVDELFCEEVVIEQMSGDGPILYVPTTLDPKA